MTKNQIVNTVKARKKYIIAGSLFVLGFVVLSNAYYLGTQYGGVCIDDFRIFQILEKFRFLRFMFA